MTTKCLDTLIPFLVRLRLKSVTNIQKITKTMQMVSAAKYARAEKELKPARVYGTGAQGRCYKLERCLAFANVLYMEDPCLNQRPTIFHF